MQMSKVRRVEGNLRTCQRDRSRLLSYVVTKTEKWPVIKTLSQINLVLGSSLPLSARSSREPQYIFLKMQALPSLVFLHMLPTVICRLTFLTPVVKPRGRGMRSQVFAYLGNVSNYLVTFHRCCINVKRLFGAVPYLGSALGTSVPIHAKQSGLPDQKKCNSGL